MMKKMLIPAAVDRLDEINAFVDAELEACGCSPKAQMQVALAVEEIFVNIASYAYNPKVGEAEISVDAGGDPPSLCPPRSGTSGAWASCW